MLLLILVIVLVAVQAELAADKPWKTDFRLPNSTYPDHYDLYLHPDLESKTFSGSSVIHINSSKERDYFLVHIKNLNITKTVLNKLDGSNKVPINIIDSFEYPENEFWVIQTDLVSPGQFELSLAFNGNLAGKIIGFYYSEYKTPSGEISPLATTKFQPTYARQAFPCFDEPSFRSTYNITVVRPSKDYIGLSNMPVMKEVPDSPKPGLTEVIFEKSVSMVSYLVCFIVCDFSFKLKVINNGAKTKVKAYAPIDRLDNMEYALEFGGETLEYFERLFKVPFPLPKSDIAAIPDYPSGATEHWGIVTFRETRVLYNESSASTTAYQGLTATISHEMVHQWFGNLVTLNWWNDLWLNEGFATYMTYRGVHNYHPSWDMNSQVVDEIQYIFGLDSKLSSHPIVQTVSTPDEITAVFDGISYSKGASVLRMLENFMGDKLFIAGITNFLNKYQYSNVVTQNLFDELTAVWGSTVPQDHKKDIGKIMETWTEQMGYPVISVVRNGNNLTFVQTRFLLDPRAVSNDSSPYNYLWDVPITVLSPSGDVKDMLYREKHNLTLTLSEGSTWFKVNPDQFNYYRVNYEPEVWSQLQELCSSLTLNPTDRSNLYDDVISLADAGLVDYSVALSFISSLTNENHFVPWKSAAAKISHMGILIRETSAFAPFKAYVSELVKERYEALGFEGGVDHLQSLLRNKIVELACWSGVQSCLQETTRMLGEWIKDPSFKLPVDTKSKIFLWGISQEKSNTSWEILWKRCLETTDANERSIYYNALSQSPDVAVLTRFLELAKDEKNIKTQDFLTVLIYISNNPKGTNLVWKWVRDNWEWLVDRYTLNDRYMGGMVSTITKSFSTQQKLDEIKEFFSKYPKAGAGERYRKEALETVDYNIFWVESYANTINQWLNNRQKS